MANSRKGIVLLAIVSLIITFSSSLCVAESPSKKGFGNNLVLDMGRAKGLRQKVEEMVGIAVPHTMMIVMIKKGDFKEMLIAGEMNSADEVLNHLFKQKGTPAVRFKSQISDFVKKHWGKLYSETIPIKEQGFGIAVAVDENYAAIALKYPRSPK